MKKRLFSILAGTLLVVGCQNYDDQFSNLESQINALASTVAGLSQVQSDLSSLAGTVSSLSSTVAALGSQFDTAVSDGLSDITADIAALQAALDGVATASELEAVAASVASQQVSLNELLANSSVYNGSITINSASTLDAFYSMGSTIAIINGNVDIDVSTTMDIKKVQSVVDNILTVTGSYDYTAGSSSVAGVTFKKLSATATLTIKQNDGYELNGLTKATNIYLDDTWETGIDIIHLGSLNTVESINTQTASHTLDFTQADEIHLTSVAYYGNDLTIKSKKGGIVDLSALTDTNTTGVVIPYDLTLHNAKALTLTKFTGDASASTANLRGTVSLTDVATVAISNFGGHIDLNGGVITATLEDVALSPALSGADDLTTLSVEGVKQSGKAYNALGSTGQAAKAYTTAYPAIDLDAANADLTSVTLTGTFSSINIDNNASVSTVKINANSASLTLDQLSDLSTVDLTGSKFNAVTVTNNSDITSLTLDYDKYTTVVASTSTADSKGDLNVSDNANLESLTVNTTSLNNIDITTNAKLAKVSFPNLVATGTGANADIDITGNKFVATSVTDNYDTTAAGAAISTGTTDDSTNTGKYTHSTGLDTLTPWLDAVITAGTTADIQVWFDQIDELKVVNSAGVATTSNPGAITEANQSYANSDGYYAAVYVYNADTSGRAVTQAFSVVIPIKVNKVGLDQALGGSEAIKVSWTSVSTTTFAKGDLYNGAAVTTVSDMINYINGTTEPAGFTLTAARDAATVARYAITYTVSGTSAAATQTAGGQKVYASFGTNPLNGTAQKLVGTVTDITVTASTVAAALADAIEQLGGYTASSTAWGATAGNEIVVAAVTSATSNRDLSPIGHSLPTLAITTNSKTALTQVRWATVPEFTGSRYATLSATVESNTLAIASSLFNVSVTKSTKSNLRLTLGSSNNNVSMFSGANAASITLDNVSAFSSETFAQDFEDGYDLITGLGGWAVDLTPNSNIIKTGAGGSSSTLNYEAAFSDIESVSTDVAAQLTDRTGWLGN